RRHTRFSRDWSSDVCSSDLCRSPVAFPYITSLPTNIPTPEPAAARTGEFPAGQSPPARAIDRLRLPGPMALVVGVLFSRVALTEIGRASCRERVEVAVGDGG